jgi:hypothetical protein
MGLLGYFGHADETQNTVFCLFEPTAKGLKADSFPDEQSVFFGTRPGRRYTFLPGFHELPTEKQMELVKARRLDNTNGAPLDMAICERIAWEYRTVQNGDDLAKVMQDLAARFPARAESKAAAPVLPVFADLRQALNVAAADTRAVIAVVHAEQHDPAFEERLARLAFEDGIAGRTHIVRMNPAEWGKAKESGQVSGGSLSSGAIFIAPEPYGQSGEVWGEIGASASIEDTRAMLAAGLQRFRDEWRKLDKKTHIANGRENGLTWSEFDPDTGGIVRIEPGSKKLGKPKKEP